MTGGQGWRGQPNTGWPAGFAIREFIIDIFVLQFTSYVSSESIGNKSGHVIMTGLGFRLPRLAVVGGGRPDSTVYYSAGRLGMGPRCRSKHLCLH